MTLDFDRAGRPARRARSHKLHHLWENLEPLLQIRDRNTGGMVYVGSTRHALPLWYTLARRAAALLSRPAPVEAPAGDASPPCAALERAAHSKAEPSGAAL